MQNIIDLLVYHAHSPEEGPQCLLCDEEDLQAIGGVHALEAELERSMYWFLRLGHLQAKRHLYGWCMSESAFEALPSPSLLYKRIGRRHPAFGRNGLELHIFEAMLGAVERTLNTWVQIDEALIEAYAVKRVGITGPKLTALALLLCNQRSAHIFIEVTVLKYWCELAEYPGYVHRHGLTVDSIISESSFSLPVTVRWSATTDRIVVAEIPIISKC